MVRGLIYTVVLLGVMLVWPRESGADGMAFKTGNGWSPLVQHHQAAVITHADGRQRMVVAIDLDLERADEAVWILPLRGRPAAIDIAHATWLPRLRGAHPGARLSEDLTATQSLLLATQIHPFAALPVLLVAVPNLMEVRTRAADVAVHQTIDAHGLRTHLVTATDVDDLASWLTAQGRRVEPAVLASFASYLDEAHTLAVTTVRSLDELRTEFPAADIPTATRRPCLAVAFPSPAPWYPMRATAGYGELELAVDLHLIGAWRPDTAWPRAHCDHLRATSLNQAGLAAAAGDSDDILDPLRWLQIESFRGQTVTNWIWSGPAAALERDLAFVPEDDPFGWGGRFADWLQAWPLITAGLIHFVASLVAGAVCGRLLFRRSWPWVGVGLLNCFTLIAILVWVRGEIFRHETRNAGWYSSLLVADAEFRPFVRTFLSLIHLVAVGFAAGVGGLLLYLLLGLAGVDGAAGFFLALAVLSVIIAAWYYAVAIGRAPAKHAHDDSWRWVAFRRRAIFPYVFSFTYLALVAVIHLGLLVPMW